MNKIAAVSFLFFIFTAKNQRTMNSEEAEKNTALATCWWLNHVQTRRCICARFFFVMQKLFDTKNTFVCLASMRARSTFEQYFACSWHLLHFDARCTKWTQNKKRKENNCIDQHQPLFLLFIFDFSSLVIFFFAMYITKSFYCRWWETQQKSWILADAVYLQQSDFT